MEYDKEENRMIMDARQDHLYFFIILFGMVVFWILAIYGRGEPGLGLGLGLEIHIITDGYLYFRKYRYAGYAILRDAHIFVTPVSQNI